MMRDFMRHVVVALLMVGALAATVWTFSAGQLRLPGSGELIVSVGAIATALEVGVVFCGFYLGELDKRIWSARTRVRADGYRKQRLGVFVSFALMMLFSGIANYHFRMMQFHDAGVAWLSALAVPFMVTVFTVILRPLQVDYDDIARQARQQAMVKLTKSAMGVLVSAMERLGRGERNPDLLDQARFAASVMALGGTSEEQRGIDYFLERSAPALPPGADGAQTVEGSLSSAQEDWITAREIATRYQIPIRTAQWQMERTPGRRKRGAGKAYEVPAQMYERLYAPDGPPARQDERQMADAVIGDASLVLASHDGLATFSARNGADVAQARRDTLC